MDKGCQDEIDNAAQDWFLIITSGQPSEQDRIDFQQWLSASPRHYNAYNELTALWAGIDGLHAAFSSAAGQVESSCESEPSASSSNVRPFYRTRKAWGGAIAACLALLTFSASDLGNVWTSDYRTSAGEQARVELPDGSVAWLNTDTAIDVRFRNGRREIMLIKGEAQFDVQKDPERPFVVNADSGQSIALGTVYSVQKQGGSIQVTVSEGQVEVVSPVQGTPHSVILAQGEQTYYYADSAPDAAIKIRPASELAWRKGFVAFNDLPVADALKEIDRYFPGHILLMADSKTLKPVTARLAISSVDNGIDALAATQGLQVSRFGDFLVVVH